MIEAITVSKMGLYIYTKTRMQKWLVLPKEYKISAQFIDFSHGLKKIHAILELFIIYFIWWKWWFSVSTIAVNNI